MVTEKKFEKLENSQASLTLTIDAASIEKAYAEKLGKYVKEVELPGFRKGHVPASVLERKFGDQIRSEVTFDLMEEELKATIPTLDEKERPLTYCVPELQNEESLVPFKKDSDVTFTVKYDIKPEFELPQYKGLEIEYEDKEVTDKDVEDEIERLRDQNAIVVNKSTPAELGDIATVDYDVIDEDGNIDADFSRNDFSLTLGKTANAFKLDDDIVGMSTGEKKTIERTYASDAEDAPEDEFKGHSWKIELTLTKLKKRELPEVDDDFAQDVKSEYKTVDDLKKGVRSDLEKKIEEYRKNAKEKAVIDAILKNVSITVPETMIDTINENKWDSFTRQFGGEENFLKMFKGSIKKESYTSMWREESAEDAKRELVLTAIADKENFEVTDAELEEKGKDYLPQLSDEQKKAYKEYLAEEVKYEKVVPFLLENNTFKAAAKKDEE